MRTLSQLGPRFLKVAAFALAAGAPSLARAADLGKCDNLDPSKYPNPIWGSGGSAATATIKQIAAQLSTLEEPVTVFYSDPGACTGYQELIDNAAKVKAFKVWHIDPADSTKIIEDTCTADAITGHPVDFAHMGNTPALCGKVRPSDIGQYTAPVQSVNIITDIDSDQNVISAEALYFIYGFGPGHATYTVTPWDNPLQAYARKTDSFVHLFVADALGLDPAAYKLPNGTVPAGEPTHFLSSNQEVVNNVVAKGAASAEAAAETVGIVSGSAAFDLDNPTKIKTLAYQAYDQTCAFLPDSSRSRADKLNVRTGQYALWTQAQLYARKGADGAPTNPVVKNFFDWFRGEKAAPDGVDIVKAVIAAGDTPLCAMQAIRTEGDNSAIQSYAPPEPCNGYFEKAATGSTDYAFCDKDDSVCDTAAGEKCRFGYCEAY